MFISCQRARFQLWTVSKLKSENFYKQKSHNNFTIMDTVETTSTATHTTRNGSRRHKQKKEIDQTRIKIRKPHMSKKDQNSSSASSPDRRKTTVRITDLRARYWSYLFENFHRAVDEIYCVCETDESTIECQV